VLLVVNRIMRTNTTASDVLGVVLRRQVFLDRLDEGAADKRTLVSQSEYSRSTVDRGVRELEAYNLVEYHEGRYRLTPFGARLTARFGALQEVVDLWLDLGPALRWLPEDGLGFDLRHLADAEVVLAEPGDPYRVVNHHVESMRSMDHGRFLLPFVGLHGAETSHDRIVNHGATCELVVSPSVAAAFEENPEYADPVAEMAATGRLSVFRATSELPLPVGLVDETVQILAAEGEEPRALVETDHPVVREWALKTFETCKQAAEPLVGPESELSV
jgi:predicted transcriptional regulator